MGYCTSEKIYIEGEPPIPKVLRHGIEDVEYGTPSSAPFESDRDVQKGDNPLQIGSQFFCQPPKGIPPFVSGAWT